MVYITCVANIIIIMGIIIRTDECMEMAYRRKGGAGRRKEHARKGRGGALHL